MIGLHITNSSRRNTMAVTHFNMTSKPDTKTLWTRELRCTTRQDYSLAIKQGNLTAYIAFKRNEGQTRYLIFNRGTAHTKSFQNAAEGLALYGQNKKYELKFITERGRSLQEVPCAFIVTRPSVSVSVCVSLVAHHERR